MRVATRETVSMEGDVEVHTSFCLGLLAGRAKLLLAGSFRQGASGTFKCSAAV